jgi:GDP/UDP-N,N'-diacetylbacillosamine 2-epimerase (hydrolysing)
MRKICVITGTRAEYGLLRCVMQGIKDDTDLILQIIATGMHLSSEFGLTYRDIEFDGFIINYKIEMLTSSDTPVGITKSIGLGSIGFADALEQLKPDLIIVLGDRYEIFSAVTAALVARIPIAHVHGGESTEGVIDEAIRHSITKMSHLHFVATAEYRQRVIQMGENPGRVFCVGGLGVDALNKLKLLDKLSLEQALDFELGPKNLLVTFHPVTLENSTAEFQMRELLDALAELTNTHLIFTFPNADTDGRVLINMIKEFVANHANAQAYESLGQLRYLSCVSHVDGVIGNSSSGLLEVPSFKKGTINIGDRQMGRLQSKSVINCDPSKDSILMALSRLYSKKFQETLSDVINPYGEGGASQKIISIIKETSLDKILKKKFYDVNKK